MAPVQCALILYTKLSESDVNYLNKRMSVFESWFSLIVYFIASIINIHVFRAEIIRHKSRIISLQKNALEISTNLRKIAYLNATLTTMYLIFLVWASLPDICQYYSLNFATWTSLNFNTCITWFQLERLKVCFGQKSHQKALPYSYPTSLFWFIRLWLMGNATFSIYVVIYFVPWIRQSPFGCGMDTLLSSIESRVTVASVIATDWIVLSLYIFKIVQLSFGVSRRNNKDNSMVVTKRLTSILSKLLILSLLMEMTFLMGSVGLTVNDTVVPMIIFNRMCLCLDGIVSMKAIFLMLQANSEELEGYMRLCKCVCLLDMESEIDNNHDKAQLDQENVVSVVCTNNESTKVEHIKYDDPSEITHTAK